MCPHTGQSSQLSVEANRRSAQLLPSVARSALNLPVPPSREHWRVKRLCVQRVTVIAHTGQSSQLPLTLTTAWFSLKIIAAYVLFDCLQFTDDIIELLRNFL